MNRSDTKTKPPEYGIGREVQQVRPPDIPAQQPSIIKKLKMILTVPVFACSIPVQ